MFDPVETDGTVRMRQMFHTVETDVGTGSRQMFNTLETDVEVIGTANATIPSSTNSIMRNRRQVCWLSTECLIFNFQCWQTKYFFNVHKNNYKSIKNISLAKLCALFVRNMLLWDERMKDLPDLLCHCHGAHGAPSQSSAWITLDVFLPSTLSFGSAGISSCSCMLGGWLRSRGPYTIKYIYSCCHRTRKLRGDDLRDFNFNMLI